MRGNSLSTNFLDLHSREGVAKDWKRLELRPCIPLQYKPNLPLQQVGWPWLSNNLTGGDFSSPTFAKTHVRRIQRHDADLFRASCVTALDDPRVLAAYKTGFLNASELFERQLEQPLTDILSFCLTGIFCHTERTFKTF